VQHRSSRPFILLFLLFGTARAEGPRIGVEVEREKDRDRGVVSHGVTLQPGWQFANGSVIDRAELLLERSLDERADSGGQREHETKVFLRIRHSGKLTESLTYYVRGGVGRSFGSDETFSYAYVEPGMKYELGKGWEWTLGLREIDSIDGTPGEHVHRVTTGPSLNLGPHHEIELRYAHTWGDKRLRALSVQYIHKF
jgi:hypothetical protein